MPEPVAERNSDTKYRLSKERLEEQIEKVREQLKRAIDPDFRNLLDETVFSINRQLDALILEYMELESAARKR